MTTPPHPEVPGLLRRLRGPLHRGVTSVPGIVAVLAIGVGVAAATVSMLDATVIRPLPIPAPDRVVQLFQQEGENTISVVSGGTIDTWEREVTGLLQVGVWRDDGLVLRWPDAGGTERLEGITATPEYFDVLGLPPRLGRWFGDSDVGQGTPVVILTSWFWTQRLGRDPGVIGSHLNLDGTEHTVIGVMPEAYDRLATAKVGIVPLVVTPAERQDHGAYSYRAIGRLAPSASIAGLATELTVLAEEVGQRFPDPEGGRTMTARPLREVLSADYRDRSLLLGIAVGLLVLMTCTNVLALLLARYAPRRAGYRLRVVLGASLGELRREVLADIAVLAVVAGVLGIPVAILALRALDWTLGGLPPANPLLLALEACGSAAILGLAIGIPLAWHLADDAIRRSADLVRPSHVAVRRSARRALLMAQVAVAVVLLVGAGLVTRSLMAIDAIDPGFRPEGLVAARVDFRPLRLGGTQAGVTRVDELLRRLAEAGVDPVSLTSAVPQGGGGFNGIRPEGAPPGDDALVVSRVRLVTPGYIELIGLPLLEGRSITAADRLGAPHVVMVSATLAELAFPGEKALGRRIACCGSAPDGGPLWHQIVGVVGDVHSNGLLQESPPEFYLPIAQASNGLWGWMQSGLTVVSTTGAIGAPEMLARRIGEAEPSLPVFGGARLTDLLSTSTADLRRTAAAVIAFAMFAVGLALLGTYGLQTRMITGRRRDLAIHLALGAPPRAVTRVALGEGVNAVIIGVLVGIGLAVAGTRLLRSVLYETGTLEPLAFAVALVGMLGTALIASWFPLRTVFRMSPMTALKAE